MILMHGNCLEELSNLEDNTIDAIVTDPPYGLSFMGKKWDYDVPSTDIWKEVLRVLKPGGHCLSFGGTRTYHRLVVAMEDAGFEIRDQIQWIYGSGFPKSHNLAGDHKGWGTALKPANEPICVARKPLEKGLTVAENVMKWGTGALNIDGTRIEAADQAVLDAAVKRMTGNKVTGWVSSNETVQPVSAQGRWPANVMFDEEAAAMLDEQSGVLKSGNLLPGHKQTGHGDKYSYRADAVIQKPYGGDSGGASRFFYVAKASKKERNAGLDGEVKQKQGARPNSADASGKFPDHDHRETGGNNHPTVKPVKLMEYLCKLITPPNGIILDPFMGSGSTGVAAKRLDYTFIGIEMSEDYIKIAEKRIQDAINNKGELLDE